jgi:polar amino acid transport system permease protein
LGDAAFPASAREVMYTFNFRDVFAAYDKLLSGLLMTLELSAVTIVLGFSLGVCVAAAASYGPKPLRKLMIAYVEVFRNTPLLVQLYIVFFGLPGFGLKLSATAASIITLTINLGAYSAEIMRAGFESIPKSQVEAGMSLGLTRFQLFRYVVFLPALKNVFPALTSQFVLLALATSVVSQISTEELFFAGSIIQSWTFRDFEVITVVSVIYLALALVLRAAFTIVSRTAFRHT